MSAEKGFYYQNILKNKQGFSKRIETLTVFSRDGWIMNDRLIFSRIVLLIFNVVILVRAPWLKAIDLKFCEAVLSIFFFYDIRVLKTWN